MGSLPWLKNREPRQNGGQHKPVGGAEVPVHSEGRLGARVMEEWSSESIQDPGSAREILDLNPEHSWADHSVPVVLWRECPEPLCPHAARSCREARSPGSQLARTDGRFQLVGQGSEDFVKLLIAPGLAAVGALAAPEETHLELCAEYFQELRSGLEPCRVERQTQESFHRLQGLLIGLFPSPTGTQQNVLKSKTSQVAPSLSSSV